MRPVKALVLAALMFGCEPLVGSEQRPTRPPEPTVRLWASASRIDHQEFVGRAAGHSGVALRIRHHLVQGVDVTGWLPRHVEAYHWTARCQGLAFSPDQLDTLTRIIYNEVPFIERVRTLRLYLVTRRFWHEPGKREYVF